MTKDRMEAFSDGVIAIIITIMVLELRPPAEATLDALKPLIPTFLSYVLSFIYIGIYWNNHHHLLQAVEKVDGRVLWANLFLLFWLSLIPFVTAWMGDTFFAAQPVAAYGGVLIMAGVAYYVLERVLIRAGGPESVLGKAVGSDLKGQLSLVFYALAIPLAFFLPYASCALYVLVAIMWLVPDPRIEKTLNQ